MIATRLLQRYGYLLPKVNPESEIAAERNLEMRARVQKMRAGGTPFLHQGKPAFRRETLPRYVRASLLRLLQ